MVLLAGVLYYAFSNHLWNSRLFRWMKIVDVPDLTGTWEGHFYTSYDGSHIPDEDIVTDGDQYSDLTKMEATIEIEQSWDRVVIHLHGPNSSTSEGATILVEENAWPTLTDNYVNSGHDIDDDLSMHYGTTSLEYKEDSDRLEGSYFTGPSRGNYGRIKVERVS